MKNKTDDLPSLNVEQRKALLKLARDTISEYLRNGQLLAFLPEEEWMLHPAGVFVTLRKEGDLRGCIGHMQADRPLYRCVQEMAISAAISDFRFPPMQKGELDQVEIEISILSPISPVEDVEAITVGKHGLMIDYLGRRGVLLPYVPVRLGWDRQEFLSNVCLKAGLPADAWKNSSAKLYSFTTLEFGEGDKATSPPLAPQG
jgi:AmmeMemoRadiSam system protein A